ncbi:hypothetical protein Bbelb_087260 [Branchiostoma belcheri]|nr:hypothetical protein Bbelb_087260 [Branchiostoma belcheri]
MEQIQESTAGVAGSASRPANNNSPLARVSSWPPNFTGPTGPHSTGKGTLQGLARCDPRCLVEASRGDRHALPPHCLREARRALPSGGSMYARRSAGAAAQDPLLHLAGAPLCTCYFRVYLNFSRSVLGESDDLFPVSAGLLDSPGPDGCDHLANATATTLSWVRSTPDTCPW